MKVTITIDVHEAPERQQPRLSDEIRTLVAQALASLSQRSESPISHPDVTIQVVGTAPTRPAKFQVPLLLELEVPGDCVATPDPEIQRQLDNFRESVLPYDNFRLTLFRATTDNLTLPTLQRGYVRLDDNGNPVLPAAASSAAIDKPHLQQLLALLGSAYDEHDPGVLSAYADARGLTEPPPVGDTLALFVARECHDHLVGQEGADGALIDLSTALENAVEQLTAVRRRVGRLMMCDHCSDIIDTQGPGTESSYCGTLHVTCGQLQEHLRDCETCRKDFLARSIL
jgi:hypothetical protein